MGGSAVYARLVIRQKVETVTSDTNTSPDQAASVEPDQTCLQRM